MPPKACLISSMAKGTAAAPDPEPRVNITGLFSGQRERIEMQGKVKLAFGVFEREKG